MNYAASAHQDITAKLPGWRATVLFGVLVIGFSGLLGRGVYLQGIHADFLQKKGDARYIRDIEISAHRGMISDRNGEPLAVSTPVESVWASPSDVEADDGKIQKLAKILGMKSKEVRQRLFNPKREFIYLKRQLPPEQIEKVVSLNIPGVRLQREYRRYYPTGEQTAQMLGFTGKDDNGQEGLELAFQDFLTGEPGSKRVIKDRRGYIVEDIVNLRVPKPGNDVELSIDSNIQYLAYRELKDAVIKHQAKSGSVVVLDPRSGEVLALVNYPSFNPNNRSKVNIQDIRNRAITDVFEPGSTMKPFAVAAAFDAGVIDDTTIIDTENGVFEIGGRKIHDHAPEAYMTVARVIQTSSNIGAAKIGLMLESKVLWNALSESGFGKHTGSEFPGEATGKLRAPKTWRPIEQATISYGHGISANLMQLARAYMIFASNGELKSISLLKMDNPARGRKIFSDRTVNSIRAMLEAVVNEDGTAPLAQVSGYRVAGKTGTSHKLENGRYVKRYIASFVGFTPVSDPRLVIAVMLDEPSNGKYYGGQVAAPVFSKIAGPALHILNVPNDAPLDKMNSPSIGSMGERI